MNKKVMDKDGSVVRNLYRTPSGALVVSDKVLQTKIRQQQLAHESMARKIEDLNTMVLELKDVVNKLMSEKK